MKTWIHIIRETVDKMRFNDVALLRSLFPSGTGLLKATPDDFVLVPESSIGGGTDKLPFREKLTITQQDTFPPLSFTPTLALVHLLKLLITGASHSPSPTKFTVDAATRQITLVAGPGYGVLPGMDVEAWYYTDDDTSAPTITSFAPTSGTVGTLLTITGTGFTPNAVVTVGGVTLTATFVSTTQLTVTLTAQNYTGSNVTVTTVTGTASQGGFSFAPPLPTITNFAPTSAQTGNSVIITGTNLYNVSAVKFGGVNAASFVVNSQTQITVTVGAGLTGAVEVITMYGTASRNGFTYVVSTPTITSFTPNLATAGTRVVITGTNFTTATAVRVNGVNVYSFTVDSPTQITAVVSKTNATGTVQVVNPSGTGTSAGTLTIDQILPFPRSGRLMTSGATTINGRSYTVSSSVSSNSPHLAFDNNQTSGSWWLSSANNGRLIIRFPFKVRVSRYTILHAAGLYPTQHYPKDWQFEGSNNGTTWTTLDTKTSVAATAAANYDIPLSDDYEYFSINVQNTNGFAAVITELVLDIFLL